MGLHGIEDEQKTEMHIFRPALFYTPSISLLVRCKLAQPPGNLNSISTPPGHSGAFDGESELSMRSWVSFLVVAEPNKRELS